MLAHQVSLVAGAVLLEIESTPALTAALEQAEKIRHNLHDTLSKILTANNDAQSIVNARNHSAAGVAAGIVELRKLKASQILKDVDRMEAMASKVGFDQLAAIDLPTFLASVQDFRHEYDGFLSDNSVVPLMELLRAAAELRNKITSISELMEWSRKMAEGGEIPWDGESELSVFLGGRHSIVEIAEKLTALNELFRQTAELMRKPDAHLRLAKLESGSIWMKVLGATPVIGAVAWMLKQGVLYLHRTYTVEGKIGAIPKQIESLESILQMRERLDRQGIDIGQVDETLRRNLAAIAGNLNRLLVHEPEVTIGLEKFSVGDALAAKMLEQPRPPLLEMHGDE